MNVTIQAEKSRVYLAGNTFPIKDAIKSMGGHWDADRKMWWVGKAKLAEATALCADAASKVAPKEDMAAKRVHAKVAYKGRTYYVIADGEERVRLTVLDGSLDFWAAKFDCDLLKTYTPRRVFGGYGRGNVEVYTTLGSLRDFVADCREADKAIAAGEIPDGYCVDLEDGGIKRRSECDMPS